MRFWPLSPDFVRELLGQDTSGVDVQSPSRMLKLLVTASRLELQDRSEPFID
jgi:hypothetical protein